MASSAPANATLLRDFVNTRDIEDGVEQLDTPSDLGSWLAERRLLAPSAEVTEQDLRAARTLREGLRSAMLVNHGTEADLPPGADEVLAQLPLRLRLGTRPELMPVDDGAGARDGLARIAVAVMASVADGTWPRLKVCQESTCQWAFLDTSKNRSRTWCSMRVCGNRTKTRAYRARLREGG